MYSCWDAMFHNNMLLATECRALEHCGIAQQKIILYPLHTMIPWNGMNDQPGYGVYSCLEGLKQGSG